MEAEAQSAPKNAFRYLNGSCDETKLYGDYEVQETLDLSLIFLTKTSIYNYLLRNLETIVQRS